MGENPDGDGSLCSRGRGIGSMQAFPDSCPWAAREGPGINSPEKRPIRRATVRTSEHHTEGDMDRLGFSCQRGTRQPFRNSQIEPLIPEAESYARPG